ncbi:hypothetical protein LTS06_011379 [Exophiala xenobiotica]|nr:hypothetical protein LTS06_011379 [Exophiala xenobiotica]
MSVPRAETDDAVDDDFLIELFYRYIHPAHPFVLPRRMYQEFPTHLRNAMCFIASHHSSEPSDTHREKMSIVFDSSVSEDGFKVQALILVTLASYARFERDQGNRALTTAIDVALRMGLTSTFFAINDGPVFQESWRRTWWELYTITGLISLIGGTNLRLVQPSQMALPTHDEDYDRCQIFQLRTSEEMQQRFSTEDNVKWSSFSYRIEAMRILSSILDLVNEATGPQCDAANASISSFLLSIPPEKRHGMKENEEVDEAMSCALMIIHLGSICLHLPRSSLATVQGLKTLSDCLVLKSPESNNLKEHVQLELSALNELGGIWPIARVVRGQIAQFVREVLNNKPAQDTFPDPVQLSELPNVDEQWLQGLMAEDLEISPQGLFNSEL